MNENKSKVMKCTRGFNGRRIHFALNSEQPEEVGCFNIIMTVDGGIETVVMLRIKDVGKVLGGMKVFSCKAIEINVHWYTLHHGGYVPDPPVKGENLRNRNTLFKYTLGMFL